MPQENATGTLGTWLLLDSQFFFHSKVLRNKGWIFYATQKKNKTQACCCSACKFSSFASMKEKKTSILENGWSWWGIDSRKDSNVRRFWASRSRMHVVPRSAWRQSQATPTSPRRTDTASLCSPRLRHPRHHFPIPPTLPPAHRRHRSCCPWRDAAAAAALSRPPSPYAFSLPLQNVLQESRFRAWDLGFKF